jgi:hypothetical protein
MKHAIRPHVARATIAVTLLAGWEINADADAIGNRTVEANSCNEAVKRPPRVQGAARIGAAEISGRGTRTRSGKA